MKSPSRAILQFALPYQPPFDWNWMIRFYAERTPGGVEWLNGSQYLRTFESPTGGHGVIEVFQSPDKNELIVHLPNSLADGAEEILARLRHQFDLDVEPDVVLACLGVLAEKNPGLRVPGAFDSYEATVRTILGQLVSVRSASTFMSRYLIAFGKKIETPFEQLNLLTPTAAQMAQVDPEEVASKIKIPATRARAIINISKAIAEGHLDLNNRSDPEAVIEQLEAIPGIGPWTAHYIAMRILRWSDAFPHSDLGLRKALNLQKKNDILAATEKWRPWRSYAAMHLWHSLTEYADL